MTPHIRRDRAPAFTGFAYATKSPDDRVKAVREAKKALKQRSDKRGSRANELTLDDFGGRSDALGG
jgi:hypothetical protein